ncbi:MAG: nickel-type superoxide dismutase maturation protease [Cyanobacteria bacterium P01_G01_bin.19]
MTQHLPETDTPALLLLLWGKRKRFKVVGKSMLPFLQPGEEILIDPQAYRRAKPQLDDVVLIKHPHNLQLNIVKRVVRIEENDNYFVVGDNLPMSTDSRHWGSIHLTKIIGKATNRFV